MTEGVEILESDTEWGNVGRGGSLGYRCSLSHNRLVCPAEVDEVLTISAHANSRLVIDLKVPSAIKGFMSGTSTWEPANPTLFAVNHGTLGVLYGPLECTSELLLPPGKYVLQCLIRKQPHSRHSAWEIKPQSRVPAPQLGILTVGRYPLVDLPWKLKNFTRSAFRCNLIPTVLGAGKKPQSWVHDKIVDVLEVLERLDGAVTHVLFSDGSDSMLLNGEDHLLAEFEKLRTPFAISMERGCWPVHDPEWRESFPEVLDNRRWPNAGGWMGTCEGVRAVLEECIGLYSQITGDGLQGRLSRWQHHAGYAHDDQWIFQLAYQNKRVPMLGDIEQKIFTNVGTASRLLSENPDYEFEAGKLKSIASNSYPSVIHFSGGAWRDCQDQWMAKLGIV